MSHVELSRVVKILSECFRLHVVILFGSRARGDFKPWSDYDLLIVAEFEEKYVDRIRTILELLGDIELNIEPHPYTLREAIEMLKRGNPIIVNAISEGIVLYRGEGYSALEELYRKLIEKGLRRDKTSIIIPPVDEESGYS